MYFAQVKTQQKLTNKMLIDRIVRETSLSEGNVKNALVSLSNVVCEALQMGMSVDLAELSSLRLTVPSKMMDSAEVTVKGALKTPKITFTSKQKMRDAAGKVELSIERTQGEYLLRLPRRRRATMRIATPHCSGGFPNHKWLKDFN